MWLVVVVVCSVVVWCGMVWFGVVLVRFDDCGLVWLGVVLVLSVVARGGMLCIPGVVLMRRVFVCFVYWCGLI